MTPNPQQAKDAVLRDSAHSDVYNALAVLVLNPTTREAIEAVDPKALEQADQAMKHLSHYRVAVTFFLNVHASTAVHASVEARREVASESLDVLFASQQPEIVPVLAEGRDD